MASGSRVAVSTTATTITGGTGYGREVTLKNAGPNTVYLGDASVTSTTGYALATTDVPVRVRIGETDSLYGICASAESATVHVLG